MRYELSDTEWRILSGMPPNKPRGVARVDDRRVLNGIFWVLRSGRVDRSHGYAGHDAAEQSDQIEVSGRR